MAHQKKIHNLIIIGSGPAGYTASIYAARANLSPTLISGLEVGGQLMTTSDVENWPGNSPSIQGPELMQNMLRHANSLDVDIISDQIIHADLSNSVFNLTGEAAQYQCKALIIATGASAKYLGIPSEQKFLGKGVSACATCDGFFYRDRSVAVIGGGNTAVEEALYLSNIAKKVFLIHRRDQLKAEAILINRLMSKQTKHGGNIEILWNNTLAEVVGDNSGVTHIILSNAKNKKTTKKEVSGVFIAIGHTPNTDMFKNQLKMKDGYILVNDDASNKATQTSIPGVFAAGDVMDSIYRQAITSAGSGCMAALDAERFLSQMSA